RKLDHGGPVTAVAFRSDGQRLAAAGENHIVRLWNAADGAQVAEIKGDYRALQLAKRRSSDVNRVKVALDSAAASQKSTEDDLATRNTAHETAVKEHAAAAQANTEAAQAAETAAAAKVQ